ncbi:hypothetical protein KCP73_07425 [Salmonella enterica subsp. enterica]|nr:hypothetical protein KCP73_07425 [Salmonella enterica subsp. enterica]
MFTNNDMTSPSFYYRNPSSRGKQARQQVTRYSTYCQRERLPPSPRLQNQ